MSDEDKNKTGQRKTCKSKAGKVNPDNKPEVAPPFDLDSQQDTVSLADLTTAASQADYDAMCAGKSFAELIEFCGGDPNLTQSHGKLKASDFVAQTPHSEPDAFAEFVATMRVDPYVDGHITVSIVALKAGCILAKVRQDGEAVEYWNPDSLAHNPDGEDQCIGPLDMIWINLVEVDAHERREEVWEEDYKAAPWADLPFPMQQCERTENGIDDSWTFKSNVEDFHNAQEIAAFLNDIPDSQVEFEVYPLLNAPAEGDVAHSIARPYFYTRVCEHLDVEPMRLNHFKRVRMRMAGYEGNGIQGIEPTMPFRTFLAMQLEDGSLARIYSRIGLNYPELKHYFGSANSDSAGVFYLVKPKETQTGMLIPSKKAVLKIENNLDINEAEIIVEDIRHFQGEARLQRAFDMRWGEWRMPDIDISDDIAETEARKTIDLLDYMRDNQSSLGMHIVDFE